MIPSEGWVTSDDGVRLYFSTLGQGDQVVVIPCGFYMTEFAKIASGRTFVMLHSRGRGRSEVPPREAMGIPREVRDLENVRQALGIERWSLVGWSYVGLVTSLYAIEHPQHVDRVVHLCSLGPDQKTYRDEMASLEKMRAARTDQETLARLREVTAGEFDKDPIRYAREFSKAVMSGQMADPSSAEKINFDFCEWPNEWPDKLHERWKGLRPSYDSWDERRRLTSISAPMFVVHGEEDSVPLSAARDMARIVANARLLRIERSGHYPWLERPDVFFPAIDGFLRGEWPRGSEIVTC